MAAFTSGKIAIGRLGIAAKAVSDGADVVALNAGFANTAAQVGIADFLSTLETTEATAKLDTSGQTAPPAAGGSGSGTVSLTALNVAVTQNFDSLGDTAAVATSIALSGWSIFEAGTGGAADGSYVGGTGSGTGGNTYSFGVAGTNAVTDRALGTLQTGTVIPTIGANFTNDTGYVINTLEIAFTGEQWRNGFNDSNVDRLDFQYSLNATSVNDASATWIDVNALDFLSLLNNGVTSAIDGNLTAARTELSSSITGLTLASGATIWIRWTDFNVNNSDDGLAIDDFSITALSDIPETQTVSIAVGPTSSVEGNSGSVIYTFIVNRTGGNTGALDFDAIFGAGNTNAVDTGGVAPTSITGTIAAGQASTTFTVTVSGDTTVEGDESFTYTITSIANSAAFTTIGTALATATISNNDGGFTGSSVAGTGAANTVSGSMLDDIFLLQTGGNDTVTGGDGNDAFYFGAAFTGADSVDGGNGALDQVGLQGDYSAGLNLSSTSALGVEQFVLLPGSDTRFGEAGTDTSLYNIVTGDAAIASGQRLIFQANLLRAGENFTLDASSETDGSVFTYGGFGIEQLTGGQGADAFYFGTGRFGASDVIDGQGGVDQVALQGTYSGANVVTFGATQLINVEMLLLFGNNDTRFGGAGSGTAYEYDIVMNDGNVAAGGQLIVQANNLASDEALTFDGSAELDGAFTIFSGNGADVIVGSAGADTISGRGNADTLTGGLGNDIFLYTNISDSISTAQDTIVDFMFGDVIDLSRIDANILTGGNGSFSFIGADAFSSAAGQLRATNMSGSDWLVEADTDGNGVADISILVTSSDADPITATDFIL